MKNKDIPKEAKRCIAGFLDKNPQRKKQTCFCLCLGACLNLNALGRLGVKGAGFAEIASHPFYSELYGGIDFELLLQKKVDPPFAPKVAVNLIDNFDKAFTQQAPRISHDGDAPHQKKKKRERRIDTDDAMFDEEEEEDVFADFNFTRQPLDDEFFSP